MTVERTLKRKLPGILDASVNFATERAHVTYIPGLVIIDDMVAAIERVGYGVIRPQEDAEAEAPELAAREADGQEKEVPISQLKVGDLLVVRPGERVPADGVIVEGASSGDRGCHPCLLL